MRKFILSFLLPLFLFGCGSNKTVIKDQDITVEVPDVKTVLEAEVKNADPDLKAAMDDFFSSLPESTYIAGSKTIIDLSGQVQTAEVKFYPNRKKDIAGKPVPEFVLDVRQSDIHIRDTDTTSFVFPKETLWDKTGSAAALAVFFLMIVLCGVIVFKFSHSFSK